MVIIKSEGTPLHQSFYGGGFQSDTDRFGQRFNHPFDNLISAQQIAFSSKYNVCCNHDFETESDLNDHFINSPEHSYCVKCEEHFAEKGRGWLYWEHMKNSPRHNFCRPCQEDFPTVEDLNEHMEQVHDWCVRCDSDAEMEFHRHGTEQQWICPQCFGDFNAENDFLMHQKVHLPRSIACHCCDMSFCSCSALIIHWENGACFGSRQLLNQSVRQFDVHGSIVPLADRNAMSYNERRTKSASEGDWNDSISKWECRLCTDGYFESFTGLNRHLESPFHDMPSFRCKGCLLNGQESRFTALSGLIQHVENTRCGKGGKGAFMRKLMEYLYSVVSSR